VIYLSSGCRDSRSMRGGRNKSSLHFSAHISGSVQKVSRLKRKRTSDLAYSRQSSFTPNGDHLLQSPVQTLLYPGLLTVDDLSALSHLLGIGGCCRFRYQGGVRYLWLDHRHCFVSLRQDTIYLWSHTSSNPPDFL
jgi:hypothetical protein